MDTGYPAIIPGLYSENAKLDSKTNPIDFEEPSQLGVIKKGNTNDPVSSPLESP